MATWLEDLLANLQTGERPSLMQTATSPFPDIPRAATPEEEAAAAQAAREAAAIRLSRGQKRFDPFGVPDASSAGIQLALEQAPAGTGFPGTMPAGAPDASPFGMVPPSLAMAKSLTANAPKAEPEPPPPGAIPTPRPRPNMAPTDVSSAGRGAPAGPVAAPMSIAPMPALPPQPGFGDRMREFAPALLGVGAALQGDMGGMTAALLKRKEDQALALENRNLTGQALLARGAPPAEVAAAVRNPDLMKALVGKYFETKPAQIVGGRMVRERPGGGVEVLADFSAEEKIPSGFRKAEDGTLHFIKGGPADPEYLREKGEKNAAPSGYRWKNPANPDEGLVAIPGGPGEKVDADVAGRLGLAKSFLGQLPEIRRRIQAGEATGPIDAVQAKIGVGGPGELRRQIDSGAEALLRMLTGAGMNKEEASDYTRRYRVSPIDTAETLLSKMGQLERELNEVGAEVGKGRGGWKAPSSRGGTVDVGGRKLQWSLD